MNDKVPNRKSRAVFSAAFSDGKVAEKVALDNGLLDINKYLVEISRRDLALFNAATKAGGATADSSTRLANWRAVKDALAKGANPRYANFMGVTTLFQLIGPTNNPIALLDDYDATMKTIIARSDLNSPAGAFNFTALHSAVNYNNLKIIGWLIEAGADLNRLDIKKRTPLDIALAGTNKDAIALLQNAGAKTHAQLQDSNTATLTPSTPAVPPTPVEAAPPANTIAKSPLDKIIMEGYDQGVTVLMQAARADKVAEVERLLKAGATVDIVGPENGYTALFFAAFGNSTASIKSLLKAGANINFLSQDGEPPMAAASFRSSANTIRALVEAGADLKYLDAAIAEAKRGNNAAVIEYLTSLKTAPKTPPVKTPTANNPKPNSAPTQSTPVAPKSIPANYKSTIQDEALHFALFVVAYKKATEQNVPDSNWSAVRTALAENATAYYADEKGVTALMLVAEALPGATEEIERKIFESADINAQDNKGLTALHIAAENNHNKMVGWLIKAGAKLNILNQSGKTPLDIATEKRNSTLIQLRNAGAKTAKQLAISSTQSKAN